MGNIAGPQWEGRKGEGERRNCIFPWIFSHGLGIVSPFRLLKQNAILCVGQDGGKNNGNVFLIVLETGKSSIKTPTYSVSDEG